MTDFYISLVLRHLLERHLLRERGLRDSIANSMRSMIMTPISVMKHLPENRPGILQIVIILRITMHLTGLTRLLNSTGIPGTIQESHDRGTIRILKLIASLPILLPLIAVPLVWMPVFLNSPRSDTSMIHTDHDLRSLPALSVVRLLSPAMLPLA
jgi:hypothetical protein